MLKKEFFTPQGYDLFLKELEYAKRNSSNVLLNNFLLEMSKAEITIIKPAKADPDLVDIGSLVDLEIQFNPINQSQRTVIIRDEKIIVGLYETKFGLGLESYNSFIGHRLMGKPIDSEIQFMNRAGKYLIRIRSIRNGFGKLNYSFSLSSTAQVWDWYDQRAHSPISTVIPDSLMKSVGKRVLDVGCGYGTNLSLLADKELRVGVDTSARRLNIAEKFYQDISFIVADANSLPFKTETFDTIILNDVIEHLSEPNQTLKECKRVLCKEGNIIVQTPNYPIYHLYRLIEYLDKDGWIKLKEDLADDPTHISKMTHNSLKGLLKRHFKDIRITADYSTLEERLHILKRLKEKKGPHIFLGCKLAAIATNKRM